MAGNQQLIDQFTLSLAIHSFPHAHQFRGQRENGNPATGRRSRGEPLEIHDTPDLQHHIRETLQHPDTKYFIDESNGRMVFWNESVQSRTMVIFSPGQLTDGDGLPGTVYRIKVSDRNNAFEAEINKSTTNMGGVAPEIRRASDLGWADNLERYAPQIREGLSKTNGFGRNLGKAGILGGFAAGVYFLAEGEYEAAAEVMMPGATTIHALEDGRNVEAILSAFEEFMIPLILTEPLRPLLQELGYDVENGIIQDIFWDDGDADTTYTIEYAYNLEATAYDVAYATFQEIYGRLIKDEPHHIAAMYEISSEQAKTPQEAIQSSFNFMMLARSELGTEIKAHIPEDLSQLPLSALGIETGDDGQPLDPEGARNIIFSKLINANFGNEVTEDFANALSEMPGHRQIVPLVIAWHAMHNRYATLLDRAKDEGINVTLPGPKESLDANENTGEQSYNPDFLRDPFAPA